MNTLSCHGFSRSPIKKGLLIGDGEHLRTTVADGWFTAPLVAPGSTKDGTMHAGLPTDVDVERWVTP